MSYTFNPFLGNLDNTPSTFKGDSAYTTLCAFSGTWSEGVVGEYLPLSGGSLTGKLFLSGASTDIARLNLGTDTTPVSSLKGDIWITGAIRYKDILGVERTVADANRTNVFSFPQIIDTENPNPALRITARGSGYALIVEDKTNPDNDPFLIDSNGTVGIGLSSLSGIDAKLTVVGAISSSGNIFSNGINLTNHTSDYNNPHQVTITQIGAASAIHYHNTSEIVDIRDLTLDSLTFATTAVETAAVGKSFWNTTTGTLQTGLVGGNVQYQQGQQLYALVHNGEGTALTKGQVVYLYSATGNKASVKLASNTSESTSSKTLGLVAENIGIGGEGFVIVQGVLEGLSLGSYSEGNYLFLGSTFGSFTSAVPVPPDHGVFIGIVERANNGNGQIYVKVQNGYELQELHNVLINNPITNHTLVYDQSTSLWNNRALSASDITNAVENINGVRGIRSLTQAEYDALVSPEPYSDVLYVIT